jgi:hypothetical protein
MANVQGVKEKLHFPVYDAFFVPPPPRVEAGAGDFAGEPTFETEMRKRDQRVIRFFVDVENKTLLDTNLQAPGVLPSLNPFEARAMRVVASNISEPTNRSLSTGPGAPTASTVLAELIYNSVTTLFVGEKIIIQVPTFFFPAGAGVTPGSALVANHGRADSRAAFRFAEPVIIDAQQNFRVEMLFPRECRGRNRP